MRIKNEIREETTIQKSKFIACAAPVKTEEEAREFIACIRKEFSDATHVCTAYIIGENPSLKRSNDNGEPSGTAGMPILQAIETLHLTDTCVCVVRYFGGIKLGTGGLVRAYNTTAQNALKNAPKVRDIACDIYSLTYAYNDSGTIENYLRRYGTILNTEYEQTVTTLFTLHSTTPIEDIENLTRGKYTPVFVETAIQSEDIISE